MRVHFPAPIYFVIIPREGATGRETRTFYLLRTEPCMNKSVETLLKHAFKCIFYNVSLNVLTVKTKRIQP